jgi:hypothetical protein
MTRNRYYIFFALSAVLFIGCQYNVESVLYGTTDCPPIEATYQMHIADIMATKCEGCHSGNNAAAGLRLNTYEQVTNAVASRGLIDRIQLPLSDPQSMPPNGGMKACDLAAILDWVQNGSPFE